MNIGINVSFLRKPHTGIGQVTTHFLDTLITENATNKSFKNHRFFLYGEESLEKELPKNFSYTHFKPRYERDDLFRKLLWERWCLRRQARKDKCDVLISLYQSATVIRYTDMKHVMVVHDIIPHIFPEYLNNLRKKMYWQQVEKGIYSSNNIVTVSEYTKNDLEKRLNVKENKISVAPIAVDEIFSKEVTTDQLENVMAKHQLTPGEYIYTGGGLEMRKETDRTIRAYKLLTERRKDVPPLVISGKLMPELAPLIVDVEKLVEELELQDNVKILDFVDQSDLPALYKGAKFFVYPSLYEGFGMPVLESMSVGTPVITTRDTSIYEVSGDAAVYVDHDDNDLCNKMMDLLSDEEMLQQLSQAGKERAQKFSWESVVKNIMNVVLS